jgi:hypothetical protein
VTSNVSDFVTESFGDLAAHPHRGAGRLPTTGFEARHVKKGQRMTRLPSPDARQYGKVFDEMAADYDRIRPMYPANSLIKLVNAATY